MDSIATSALQELRAVVRTGDVIEFKDEGETPEGLPIGRLVVRSSGLPVFPDGRWGTLAEARYIAKYFGVELFES
jgi:hypothetical protein